MGDPIATLIENTNEVQNLVKAHVRMTGSHPGRRYGVEILNKSGIVMLTACWEAFVEDTASIAYEALIEKSADYRTLPEEVLKKVAKWIKEDRHELKVWSLAGEGWRAVLRDYKVMMLNKYIGPFHNPRAGNIDNLFKDLIGVISVSDKWRWPGMTPQKAKDKLSEYIALRGAIAHRVKASKKVHKRTVIKYAIFINYLAVLTANMTTRYIQSLVGVNPWAHYTYKSIN